MQRPYLSIVMASRNDDHGGDLNQRTQACIDSLSGQIQKFGISAEIIMVDWNPPAGKPLLHEAIHGNFRSIIVPPEIHNRYGQSKLLPFYQMIAKNAGIRRANGEFILATNVDILFSDELMEYLSKRKLAEGHLYRAIRCDIKPGIKNIEDAKHHIIKVNVSRFEELFTNACGDFQLLHRNDWMNLRGYLERDLFSVHIDSVFEYHAVYQGCNEVILRPPKVIFHVEHQNGYSNSDNFKEYNCMNDPKITKLNWGNVVHIAQYMSKEKESFHYNSDRWGLVDDVLEEVDPS